MLNQAERTQLLALAWQSIITEFDGLPLPELPFHFDSLNILGASFVTLTLDGKLRGCIGSLSAQRPLSQDVAQNARLAAFSDPRFSPMCRGEADRLDIEISVLSPAEPWLGTFTDFLALLESERPGVVLTIDSNRATFLPQVWDQFSKAQDFLSALSQKAGSGHSAWKNPGARFLTYTVEHFRR